MLLLRSGCDPESSGRGSLLAHCPGDQDFIPRLLPISMNKPSAWHPVGLGALMELPTQGAGFQNGVLLLGGGACGATGP